MRVLITGDREWTDALKIRRVLECLKHIHPDAIVVEGEARGADSIAKLLAEELGFKVEGHRAEWTKYRKAAGPIRNQFMIDESRRRAEVDGHHLEHAVAFHADLANSKGTLDMVRRLERAGINVLRIT
jgi:hypothetical protein